MRTMLLGAATLIVALIAMLGNAGAASAACETGVAGAVGVSKTFAYCAGTPGEGEQSYVVPLGVTQVRVVAIGARGANRLNQGGHGGRVEQILTVPVASTLFVLVGGTGDQDSFNGGGISGTVLSGTKFNGGGASDVRTISCGASCPGSAASLNSRLIVGAGGGGAGPCGTTGGHGGGQANGDGNDGGLCASDLGPPARGGTQSAGGAGAPDVAASNGALGVGGSHPNAGGGGGGLYGGGAGGGTGGLSTRGGGGGSSFGPAGTAFSTTTDAASVTITPFVATSTVVSATPSPTQYGETATFTATVANTLNGSPASGGTVQFRDGATPIGSPVSLNASGEASLNISSLTAGSHTIVADYNGSTGFGASSGSQSYTVTKQDVTATVATSGSPSEFGETVTFTATVTPDAGALDGGTVQFFDGASPVGSPVSVNTGTGQASLATSSLLAGSHTITAQYSGTSNFNGDTSPDLTQTVDKASTTTAVGPSSNPSAYGDSVTFTATVTPASGALTGGTVQFSVDGTPIGGPVAVNTTTGTATFSTSSLTAGAHTIAAAYSGSDNHTDSSGNMTQTVGKRDTSTTVTTAVSPSTYGDDVTLTAVVAPVGGTAGLDAGSTVQFYDGTDPLGTPQPVDTGTGQAELTLDTLAVGTRTIKAAYLGSANFNTSEDTAGHVVNKADATATIASNLNPSTYGEGVKLTAEVTPASGDLNGDGTVQFFDGADPIGAAQPVDAATDEATLTVSSLGAGTHSLTARYLGGTSFNGDDSPALTQTVNKAATTTTLTGPSSAVAGQTATLTAAVGSGAGTPGGQVTFRDGDTVIGTAAVGGDGRAMLTTGELTVGTRRYSAAYGGGANHEPSSSVALDVPVSAAPVGEPEIVPRVGISHRIVPLRSGRVVLALTCRAATGARCLGKVTLRVTSATSRLVKPAAVGSASYSIAAGQKRTLRIIPPKNIAKMFKKRGRAVVQVTIAQTGGKRIRKLITVVPAR